MNRTTTAYHEAGHAVVAFFSGFRIEYATILPGDGFSGMMKARPQGRFSLDSATPAMRQKTENWILITLAGDIAQRKHAPRSSRQWHTTADRQAATDLALSVCGNGESATAYLAWLNIVARQLIEGRWDLVDRVAKVLLDRERITGDELRAIILTPTRASTD